METKDVNERIELFYKSKTYSFIRNIFQKIFNGYIKEIKGDYINFKDDFLGIIPIRISEIDFIDYSNKKEENKEQDEHK